VLDLVDRYGGPMFLSGAAGTVLRWLDAIPRGRYACRPELALRRAYLLTMVGDTRVAEQVLRDAETRTPGPGEQTAINALRATWAFFDAPPRSAIRAADAVLDTVGDDDPEGIPDIFGITSPASLRTMAAASRARALWYLGDVAAARRTFAAILEQRDTYLPWRVHALSALALLEAWAGNLRVAHKLAREALTTATGSQLLHHPATMDARLAAAHVSRDRGDLRRAAASLDEAHTIATATRRPITLAIHAVERALWHLAAGRPDLGLAEIDRNRASGNPPPPPNVQRRQRAVEVRLLLARGDVERARSILEVDTNAGGRSSDLAAEAAYAAVMRGDLAAARTHLDRWSVEAAVPRARLERDLWTAIVEAEAGNRRQALKAASALVAEAQAEGHVRLFLDGGRPAKRLLRDLHHAAPTPYVRHVLRSAAPRSQATGGDATVDLSERELEVVRYLPTPLSSGEIAAQLYISLNTLKTHLRAIYRKLGVDGRQEAVRRAVDLGIA
jgi:ATP/maltotriose-dependent transcriptional regulator MalT